jgi:hypothetical protein
MRVLGCWVGLALALSCGAAKAALDEVWVRTDRTVDNSSLETIIRDVIKPDMSNEAKAIAIFNYMRRNVFHHKNTADSRDPVKLVNILGYTLCGSQGTVCKALCKAAGFEARVVCWPNGAHTFYEVKYDDQWHVFDTFTNFYVYTRGDKKHIASMEELKADPTLAIDAAKEGRACPGFLHCGDGAKPFTVGWKDLAYNANKSDYSPKRLSLFKGMEFIRGWNCDGKAGPGSWEADGPGPKHTCGGKDDKSAENFAYWEPYLVKNMKATSRSYRHWGSGKALYSPDLRAGDWQDSALQADNLKSGAAGEPALHPAEAGKDAAWVFDLQIPYYITEAKLDVFARKKNAEDTLSVSVSADQGKTWVEVWKLDAAGEKKDSVSLDKALVVFPGRMSYRVKVSMKASKDAADVGLEGLCLNTVFQHNMMSAPALAPGKNKVTVESKPAKDKPFTPFEVVYAYQEGPKWDGVPVKEAKWDVSAASADFDVELPECPKQHRMLSLTYRCGKLAWVPEAPKPEAPAAPPVAPAATDKPAAPPAPEKQPAK